MGGKALKEINTIRLDKKDYLLHKKKIFSILSSFSDNFHFIEVPSLKEKEDFGDMDILYYSNDGEGLDKETLYQLFNKNNNGQVVKNGNVISVSYLIKENIYFQLDFIYVDKKDLNFNLFYLGYNDVGNLLGIISTSLNLKLKNNGLFYHFVEPENPSKFYGDILITNNIEEALDILGYDSLDYFPKIEKGFLNKKDIYDFLIKSKYFNIDYYLIENQNSKHRKRDKKRGTYSDFLLYLEELSSKNISNNNFTKKVDKNIVFNQLLINFPIFRESYKNKVKEVEKNKIFKEKFNRNIFESITGYKGKELGKFIQAYKIKFGDDNAFKDFIISNDKYDIEKSIILFLSVYN